MRVPRSGIIVCMLVSFGALTAHQAGAQDTHYWNNQFGPRSMLLSGAVIGSVRDMSATFYNPGALGYIEQPEVLLSANAYQLENLRIQDGGGNGVDLESSNFNLLPNMLAGAFRTSWLGRNKVAYSLLTRHRFDAEVRGARTGRLDVLPDAGEEEFAGAVRGTADAKELWAGVTWARGEMGDKIGFGVTTYLSIRNESGVSEKFAQALTDTGRIALVYDVDNFSADVYSLIWKAGFGINLYPLTLGITLTTPNLQLTSKGESVFNETIVGIDTDDDGTPDNSFETSFQEDVNANYRSPLSIGFGAGYYFAHTELHFAAEWFDEVSGYDVLELESFTSQATGLPVDRSLRQARQSVFNFALGIEQDLGERWSGFLSFNSDQSSFDAASDVSATNFDIYHVTGGLSAEMGRTRWMVGLSYARGSEDVTQLIDLDPDGGTVVNPDDRVDVEYSRMTFLVGFRVGI